MEKAQRRECYRRRMIKKRNIASDSSTRSEDKHIGDKRIASEKEERFPILKLYV